MSNPILQHCVSPEVLERLQNELHMTQTSIPDALRAEGYQATSDEVASVTWQLTSGEEWAIRLCDECGCWTRTDPCETCAHREKEAMAR